MKASIQTYSHEAHGDRHSGRSSILMLISALLVLFLQGCGGNKKTELPGGRIAEEVEFDSGSETLSGTLTLPAGNGPHPAVVLISGSGPQDRDGGMRVLPGYKPFKEIADALSASGVAVLRYDDRGYMKSSGNYLRAEEDDFISDAEAAMNYLSGRKDLESRRIGLAGHSEGAMIAAQVASRNKHAAYIVSLAGPATDGRSLLLKQTERINTAAGLTGEELKKSLEAQSEIFDMVAAGDWDGLNDLIQKVTLKSLLNMPAERTASMGDLGMVAKRKAEQSIKAFKNARYQYLLNHDFSADWRKLDVPILAIFGELDVQCDAGQNATALKEACAAARNKGLKIIVLKDTNHLFLKAQTGSPLEYANLPKSIVPELDKQIISWLREINVL